MKKNLLVMIMIMIIIIMIFVSCAAYEKIQEKDLYVKGKFKILETGSLFDNTSYPSYEIIQDRKTNIKYMIINQGIGKAITQYIE